MWHLLLFLENSTLERKVDSIPACFHRLVFPTSWAIHYIVVISVLPVTSFLFYLLLFVCVLVYVTMTNRSLLFSTAANPFRSLFLLLV